MFIYIYIYIYIYSNCLRFANPTEALGGRHLEAQRQGGLEDRRLYYDGVVQVLGSSLMVSWELQKLYYELSIIEHVWATGYLEERHDLSGPLGHYCGRLQGSWEALGVSKGLLGGPWEPLGAILEPLGRVFGPLGAVLGPLGVVSWGVSWHHLIFGLFFGSILDRFWPPFWPPFSTNFRHHFETNFDLDFWPDFDLFLKPFSF